MIESRMLKNTSYVVLGFIFGLASVFGFVFIVFNDSSHKGRSSSDPNDNSHDFSTMSQNLTTSEGVLINVSNIEQELKSKGPFHRTLTLHNFLSSASPKKHSDLFQLAQKIRPSTLRDEIQNTVVQKLALLRPKTALSLIEQVPQGRRDALFETAFMEIALSDLDKAISLAKTLDTTQRPSALYGILLGSENVPHDRLRDIASQLGDEQIALDRIALSLVGAAVDDPSAMWTELLNEYGDNIESLSEAQIQLLVYVAKVWTEESGTSAIQSLYSSLSRDDSRIALVTNLLQELNQSNPQLVLEVAQWIKTTDLEVLAEAFAEWAKTNPLIALDVATAIELSGQHTRMQRSVIESWIRSDPNSLLEALNQLPESLQDWSQHEALLWMTNTTPELVPTWLQGVENEYSREIVIGNLIYDWVEHDPLRVWQWVHSDAQAKKLLPQFIDDILRNMAHVDSARALEIALEQPIQGPDVGLEALVIAETARVDAERAIAMLENARTQDTRKEAQIGIGVALVKQGEFERLMELSTTLPEEFRDQFFYGLSSTWVHNHPESLIEQLDSLPSQEVRMAMIRELLFVNQFTGALSKEQIDMLKNLQSE